MPIRYNVCKRRARGIHLSRIITNSTKATRAQTKEHNKRLILKAIYDQAPISRADLARFTKLTRASISNVVAPLLEEELVIETGLAHKNIGKPPTLLTINEDARHLISLDLANGAFHGNIFNLKGKVVERVDIPLDDRRGEDAVQLVFRLVEQLMEKVTRPLLGIGIGTPGVVEPRQGVVKSAINLNWMDLPLGPLLEERFELPVYLANDAQVAALAQYLFSSKKQDTENLILVKVGRGIGSGIVFGGEIFYGDGFSAGEIGHVVVDPSGVLCTCGHYGCLETKASTNALMEDVERIARANPSSKLYDLVKRGDELTPEAVLEAHLNNDFTIRPVIERSGRYLGAAIAHLVAALNIRNIYIAGSMAQFGPALLEPVQQEVDRLSFPALTNQINIRISDLGPEIVALGAAALVLNYEMGVV